MDPLLPARVLCVEGNGAFLRALESSFHDYRCEVVTATRRIEAIMQLQRHDGLFAAVIVDDDISGMTGPALFRHLRAVDYRGYALVTSRSLTSGDFRAYEGGAVSGFFHKLFEPSVVVDLLMAGISP